MQCLELLLRGVPTSRVWLHTHGRKGLTHAVVEELVDGVVCSADEVRQHKPRAQGGAVEAEEAHNLSHDKDRVEYGGPEASGHLPLVYKTRPLRLT